MKKIIYTILLILSPLFLISQMEISLCVDIDEIDTSGYDIFSNLPGFNPDKLQFPQSECYFVVNGRLFLSENEECCDEYRIPFSFGSGKPFFLDLQIKCAEPKPNCTTIDLSEYDITDDPIGGNQEPVKPIIVGCENTPITYITPEAPGQTITWDAGSVPITQGPDNVAVISWPNEGNYTLTVTVGSESTTYCIEILDSPEADFTISGSCGCLNSAIDFMSTSIGGNEFFWDFGDGSYGTGATSSHAYTTPGIYDVTLVVVQDNFDAEGNPLCCCADTITMPVTIEPLEGPNIYWISTLCEGDTTKYWTDAMDCSYIWTAIDSDGISVLPISTDITNDTLCVVWGDGPFGTVSLEVSGCSDGPYCAKPTSVIVPIIEQNTTIEGRDTVCSNSASFYDVPKWPTVEYEWEIIPASAGMILSGQGTNSIYIQWTTGPASATINVSYGSEFLGGIVGHTPEDCEGSASFDVDILPKFEIKSPTESQFCIDENFNLLAGDVGPTNIDPVNGWTWEIRPTTGPDIVFTGIFGAYTTSLSMPGSYVIAAYPDYPNPYCNDTVFTSINIVEVALPDSISGNKEVCPDAIETYFGFASEPGIQLEWDVLNGSFVGPSTGNPVTIDWNPTGPYEVLVKQVQISDPNCESDYISCPIDIKMIPPPTDIIGNNACANEVETYTADPIPTDPDATFSWSITPSTAGSVISGDNATTSDIQWNNYSGTVMITFTQTLCDTPQSYTESFTINMNPTVTITQSGPYCEGSTTSTLMASTLGSYNWVTPSGSPAPSTQTITILEDGNYTLTVTDAIGCTAVANYTVNAIPGPNTNLTSPDILNLCTSGIGDMVSLHALSGPWTIVEWWKKTNAGPYILQPLPVDPLEYIHINSGTVGTCTYYYVAENADLCRTTSNTIVVTQSICPTGGGSGDNCDPENHTIDLTYTPSTNCNKVTFNPVVSPNVTITGWDFNDPVNISPVYPGPMFTYTTAGYYVAYMYYSVPDVDGGPDCDLWETESVCVPMVADFSITNNNCGEYTFTNTSSFISGMEPTSFDWQFGDGNIASGTPVSHTYSSDGFFSVTLTITNDDGCESEITIGVDVLPPPTANIIAMPADTCVDKPIQFINMDNTGIVAWDWDFGDGSTNLSEAPSHAYNPDNTYTVTLTVTDEFGCTDTDVQNVTIHPNPVEGPITYLDDLFLCPGESIDLNAPAGASYMWNTGDITQTISVSMGGEYSVTVSDANGCTFSPDPVEVIELPEINADISGSNAICDDGCTTLFAANEAGYTYVWTNQVGTVLPANFPPSSIDICFGTGILEVNLSITDANGCEATSTINIEYYTSPDVTITPSDPDLCAGTPNILTASTTYPDPVDYKWSTGDLGNTITVALEGSYYVTVTDPVTGCYSTDVITINPLPDLCIVPAGCYNTCGPDTLYAPSGLDAYEWYFNGTIQPLWSGLDSIIVSETGAYNFEGTNSFGCTDISDTLYLIMEPCCREGDTQIDASPLAAVGTCCYSFNYTLSQDIFYSLDLHSLDAGLGIDLGSVDPSLAITSSIPSLNSFENDTSGDPLPFGPLTGFIIICLEDVISDPVEILADWRGVCNPADGEFPISYIDIVELAPVSAVITPSFEDLSPGSLAPGDCIDLSFIISGSGIANDSLKYKLVAHENNPEEDPSTLCCASEETYCEFIPGCTLCDMVYISAVDTSDIGECCYEISINNYASPDIFNGIGICAITEGSTFDILNPIGSPWSIDALSTTNANLSHSSGSIPVGDMTLPTICISESNTPIVQIEIKWMESEDVICRDTIDLLCENDCGYMSNVTLECGPDGTWVFSGSITNTSDYTMSSANIDFGIDGFEGYDGSVNLGNLDPGETYGPFVIILDIPNGDIETLCITTTLHSLGHNEDHETCCQFKTVLDAPQDCDPDVNCECGPKFENEVELGVNCNQVSGLTYLFSPVGNFSDCDQVIWDWLSEQTANTTIGNQTITHTFPGPGEYKMCMTVIRTTPTGKQCKHRFCKEVDVFSGIQVDAFPNPTSSRLMIRVDEESFEKSTKFELMDMNNRVAISQEAMFSSKAPLELNVEGLKTGIYILRITTGDMKITKRILVVQ